MGDFLATYLEVIKNAYVGYGSYLLRDIINPSFKSYFWWLVLVSLFFLALEYFNPWRKGQKVIRKDFWLDGFYMFFNFFLFSLIIYNAASDVIVKLFNGWVVMLSGIDLSAVNPMYSWPLWSILLTVFFVRDFVQWWTHRLLHRVPFLWNFHKVHHSVEQMGFAAHLRYHWMETIVYRTIEYLPLALLGVGLHEFFIVHIFTLAIGHYNHSNITIDRKWTGLVVSGFIGLLCAFGVADISFLNTYSLMIKVVFVLSTLLFGYFILSRIMKFLFNSPEMHIWHHAKEIPSDRSNGVNFGLTLAIWDYLFGTAYIPYDGRDIPLGFDGVEDFPATFKDQIKYGFGNKS